MCRRATSCSSLPFGGVTAEICEDLVVGDFAGAGAGDGGGGDLCATRARRRLRRFKNEERKRLVMGTASVLKSVYAYANLLGCDNSRLVFDGGGLIATPDSLVT